MQYLWNAKILTGYQNPALLTIEVTFDPQTLRQDALTGHETINFSEVTE